MARIFLSYARDDQSRVSELAGALERAGHVVWWDRRLTGGAEFAQEIERALADAEVVIVVWSTKASKSHWVRDEAAVGRDSHRLVPVAIDNTSPPLGFGQFYTIDLSGWESRDLADCPELEAAIAAKAEGRGRREAARVASDNPPLARRDLSPWKPARAMPSRRAVLVGGAAVGIAGAATGVFFVLRTSRDERSVPAEIALLWTRAVAALHQGSPEANEQALGLLRQIVERAPEFADGWGALAVAYAAAYRGLGGRTGADSAERASAAIQRARALQPGNAYADQAEIALLGMSGSWMAFETRVRASVQRHPRHFGLVGQLGWLLWQVGRLRESLVHWQEMLSLDQASPWPHNACATVLWATNRLEEADRAFRENLELFPSYPAIWFGRFEFLLVSGRIAEALGLLDNQSGWPVGIPHSEFAELRQTALALQSRDPAAIDAVMRLNSEKARRGTGYAEVAIKYASLFGRLNEAFVIANAFFFGRGFDLGDLRYTAEAGIRDPRRERRTHFLFLPTTAALRADPRFERLVSEIGLARYWADSGTRPDYRG